MSQTRRRTFGFERFVADEWRDEPLSSTAHLMILGFPNRRDQRITAVGIGLAAVMLCAFADPAVDSDPLLEAVETLAADDAVIAPAEPALTLLGSGRASFYASKFDGRRTASGERFDNDALTAAHRTLPMGSLVKVTCEKTGKSVTVRVNDRGPYAHARVIDLSQAAARELGMINAGTASVTLELLPTT